jgi:hypothetical protein
MLGISNILIINLMNLGDQKFIGYQHDVTIIVMQACDHGSRNVVGRSKHPNTPICLRGVDIWQGHIELATTVVTVGSRWYWAGTYNYQAKQPIARKLSGIGCYCRKSRG